MKTLLENQAVEQHAGTEAALQRSAQIAAIAGLSILAVAGLYFLALYMLSR